MTNMLNFFGFFVYEYGELLKRELIVSLFRIDPVVPFSHKDLLKAAIDGFDQGADYERTTRKYYEDQKKLYAEYMKASEAEPGKANSKWPQLKFEVYEAKNTALSSDKIRTGFCDAFHPSMSMFENLPSIGVETKKVYSNNKDFVVTLVNMYSDYERDTATFPGALQTYLNDTKNVIESNPKPTKTKFEIVKPTTFDVSLALLARYTNLPVTQGDLYYSGNDREAVQHVWKTIPAYEIKFIEFVRFDKSGDILMNSLINENNKVKKAINIDLLCYKYISLHDNVISRLFDSYVNRLLAQKKVVNEGEIKLPLNFDANTWPRLKKKMDDHNENITNMSDPRIQEIVIHGTMKTEITKFFNEVSLSAKKKPDRLHIYILNLKKIENEEDVDEILSLTPSFSALAPHYSKLEDALKSVVKHKEITLHNMVKMLTSDMSVLLYDKPKDVGKILADMEKQRIAYATNQKNVLVKGKLDKEYENYVKWLHYYYCEKFKIFLILCTLGDLNKGDFQKKWIDNEKFIEGFKGKSVKEIATAYRDAIMPIVYTKADMDKIKPYAGGAKNEFPKPGGSLVVFPGDFGAEISLDKSTVDVTALYSDDKFMDVVKYVSDNLDIKHPDELITHLKANYVSGIPWVYTMCCVIARKSQLTKDARILTHEFLGQVAGMLDLGDHANTLKNAKITDIEYIKIFRDMIRALENKKGVSEMTKDEKIAIESMFLNSDTLETVERAIGKGDSGLYPHKDLLKQVCDSLRVLFKKMALDSVDAQKMRAMDAITRKSHKN